MRLARDGGKGLQVHAGAEGFSGAGDNADAGGAFFDLVESGLNFGNHARGDGVALVGAIQSDDGEVAGKFELQGFKHLSRSFLQYLTSDTSLRLARKYEQRFNRLISFAYLGKNRTLRNEGCGTPFRIGGCKMRCQIYWTMGACAYFERISLVI